MVYIGKAVSRVDGPAKVTGTARYAGEFATPGLTFGVVVSSTIAHGRITAIDDAAARAVAGVLQVFTHENRPRTAYFSRKWRDEVAPPGSPFRPLYDEAIHYSGQPAALVVAETFEAARYAASLVRVSYQEEAHATDLDAQRDAAYEPPKKRSGIAPPPKPRGDSAAALESAPRRIEREYIQPPEHHNPMEMHATTVFYEEGGKLVVHDKTQGVQNVQSYITSVFGLSADDVQVISPFVGGAFGSGLRPQYNVFLAVMAAVELQRSVRVTLTRQQMFTFGFRPNVIQHIALGANPNGTLTALEHEAISSTSQFEDYQENVVNWSGLLYPAENATMSYKLAKLDVATPIDMRAPGAATGAFAIETAMDELAHELGIDPVELRLRNYAEDDKNEGKAFTSKALRGCYAEGAGRFGWSKRNPVPRSMREGRELIGWGMATGCWEALHMKAAARATLRAGGTLEIASATADIGTGTYTIMAQIAAETMGLPIEAVQVTIGDSSLPKSPVEGGSWTAASVGAAVQAACETLRGKLFKLARGLDGSPLGNADLSHVVFADGEIRVADAPGRAVSLDAALAASGETALVVEEAVGPGLVSMMRYTRNTHSAVFAEVRVDEELGVVRVTRIVNAVAAGRILNLKTARSQILGGVIWGLGMATHEETMTDHALGRFMNHSLAEYHVPVHADAPEVEVIFVEEHDPEVNPLGVKGLGEIGIVGTAAAIGNAIFHATGKRVRDLPITIDKLL